MRGCVGVWVSSPSSQDTWESERGLSPLYDGEEERERRGREYVRRVRSRKRDGDKI